MTPSPLHMSSDQGLQDRAFGSMRRAYRSITAPPLALGVCTLA
jgi:hypothetical protein